MEKAKIVILIFCVAFVILARWLKWYDDVWWEEDIHDPRDPRD